MKINPIISVSNNGVTSIGQTLSLDATDSPNKVGQIAALSWDFDDFIDVKGSKKLAGKPIKKDKKKGKSTLINLLGYNRAYNYANNLKNSILKKLKKHGNKAKDLNDTVEFILQRKF